MARLQKVDRGMAARLDELEKHIFVLKILYEKYFSGLDQSEPTRERDEVRRDLRDLWAEPMVNGRQRFRLQQLKARWGTLELYWARNALQVERGTHPKQIHRANFRERLKQEAEADRAAKAAAGGGEGQTVGALSTPPSDGAERPNRASREEQGYQAVFDAYMRTRAECGQNTEIDYAAVRDTLKKQVETLKARTQCTTVKFRVVVEDGKAKVKAVPVS